MPAMIAAVRSCRKRKPCDRGAAAAADRRAARALRDRDLGYGIADAEAARAD
jgi:hypothetical protein